MSGMHLSKEFFELLKSIGESKSKQEEDRIILRETTVLKKKLETPSASKLKGGGPSSNVLSTNKKKAKEFLLRMLYVEMLGHDASFGYIKAVEMAASSSIVHKRTGYLLCSCCLAPEHEFRFMLVNQMQRDLSSSSVLEVSAALIAVTNIITNDMVPAISTEVIKLLDHSNEVVRKKAIMAMHRFHQLAPEVVERSEITEKLRKMICDRDPSVMGASLNVIEAVATVDPEPFKDLVSSLISILKQVIEHRLPTDFDYHRVPAPWIQMKIVRILSVLGKSDATASNGMYEILAECMKRADVGINAGYAIVYECVRTITVIYPNPTLLDAAAEAISRFITSKSQNLKYLGVTSLAAIVESHPKYATEHQMSVIECLEDRDETLQRRTLDLLYKMTNPMNVQFITEKLLQFCSRTTEPFLKEDLTLKVCNLAERYAPNNLWYIETITELFEVNGDMIKQEVAQNLMTLIAEGAGEDGEDVGEEADIVLRQHSVTLYANLLQRPHGKFPRLLIETMAWILGEYGYLSEQNSLEEISAKLCELVRRGKKLQPGTQKIVVSAIMKLVAQAGNCPPQAAKVIDDFTKSKDVDLQQRCLEFQKIITTAPHMLAEVLPVDASCEDVQVDPNLTFLDSYVHQKIIDGAKEYEKPEDDDDDDYDVTFSSSKRTAFNMTPYQKPSTSSSSVGLMRGMGSTSSNAASASGVTLPPGGYNDSNISAPSASSTSQVQSSGEPQLVLRNVANVWGKPAGAATTATPTQTPTPAPPQFTSSTNDNWSTSYNQTSQQTTQPVVEAAVKTEEQIRKERMAAALFGGTAPGSMPEAPPPKPSISKRTAPKTVVAAAPTPVATAPPPPPAPTVDFDLLDLMSDPTPMTSNTNTSTSEVDILTPTPMDIPVTAPAPAPVPDPPSTVLDPFAEMDDFTQDTPLASLSTSSLFEYNGSSLAPLKISTAQFGEKWGSCPHDSPITTTTASKISTLSDFMNLCESVGAYPIESITATNEGICAGMLGGGVNMILIHGKVSSPGHVEATIKSTDATLSGCLAMYMQNMMT